MNYKEILETTGDFLSLDISVNGTGWFEYYKGKESYGCYSIKSKEDIGRRKEYIEWLKTLIGNKEYNVIYLEDSIQGQNYQTNKKLIELNTIPLDLMLYHQIKECPIVKVLGIVWQKQLKLLSNSTPKEYERKLIVQEILNSLGFSISVEEAKALGGTKADCNQDIYDALGMSLAMITTSKSNNNIITENTQSKKVQTDISKGYNYQQYRNLEEMEKDVQKRISRKKKKENKIIRHLKYEDSYKDLKTQFKLFVEEQGDRGIIEIETPLNKVGTLMVTQGFDITKDYIYFTVERKN